jgi:hypothetical protein
MLIVAPKNVERDERVVDGPHDVTLGVALERH